MKATLEFNLPTDQSKFNMACDSDQYWGILWDIDNKLRNLLKHDTPTPEEEKLADEIRGMITVDWERVD